ncbi:DUF3325 domain-containing protein [Acinetobacter sp.]|uniref:DUF3325 domain-containing protein n=1 Tax=Acinetobacter sp. TaxID=472 RepID=UPI002FDB32AD
MSAWILWCISVFAFSSLACGMNKHQRDIFTAKVTEQKTRLFQIVGWVVLAVSAVLVLFWKGASIGMTEWLCCLTFAALAVGLTLTYFPKKLFQLNGVVAGLFVILLIVFLI